jgi:hypothetical protein
MNDHYHDGDEEDFPVGLEEIDPLSLDNLDAAEIEDILLYGGSIEGGSEPGDLLKIKNTLEGTPYESHANQAISLTECYVRNSLAEDFPNANVDRDELLASWDALNAIACDIEETEEVNANKIYDLVGLLEKKVQEILGEDVQENR